ncbi:nucleobase:cation symporter-2 family protein [Marinobacter nanhaiticus D15-8W]|uniref:Purine permease n=1 Tax=Marinobacter nanhaiticus D15-8W TaxID=626887 RepID=N6WNE7_9GAMM|nr:nucleobase:cation symporter-2 family protein [Marinobacter nanhaiticus]ENO13046.1 purine permease [Marinobacter nanhaiticus D15-8W]BES70401.1 nucleobase:cation symporter-2 family protein [Marinobacter nanhaiticus D15-8W]
MTSSPDPQSELLYGLDDRPPVPAALLAALQHMLASFVAIITPTLIIGGTLGLGSEIPYLISMALVVSGVGTFIQARRFGPVGSGLMALQGTSFAFLSSILAAGFIAKAKGGGPDEILSLIFGVCFFGAFVEIVLSQFLHKLKTFINPLVTGIVITTIGLSLIKVGVTDLAGGFNAPDFGSLTNLALGGGVLLLIIIMNQSRNMYLRSGAIFVGLVVGFLVAIGMGKVDFSGLSELDWYALPVPFKYGISFDFAAFLPVALIYLITTIEASGDLTATSMISKQPISGDKYRQRIRAGVLADGVNSAIAAVFNTFPNTTFSQNNGVIQLTGIASRYVAYWIAGILVLLGLFPIIGGVLQQLPKPVLGGATLVMFGTVAAAGIRILATVNMDRRSMLIMAVAFGLGLGVDSVPDLFKNLPEMAQNVMGSAVTMSGLSALILNTVLSGRPVEDVEVPAKDPATSV